MPVPSLHERQILTAKTSYNTTIVLIIVIIIIAGASTGRFSEAGLLE